MTFPQLRVGLGTDCHRFVSGRPLILGGVSIPYDRGLEGHSDADAVLHAICDALLGALALGDIGDHFPDTDPKWKDVNSGFLVKSCLEKVSSRGWQVGNLDLVIHTQHPKIAPYREPLRQNLSDLLKIPMGCISVKAKTGEGVGPVGLGKCLETQAIVLLIKSS